MPAFVGVAQRLPLWPFVAASAMTHVLGGLLPYGAPASAHTAERELVYFELTEVPRTRELPARARTQEPSPSILPRPERRVRGPQAPKSVERSPMPAAISPEPAASRQEAPPPSRRLDLSPLAAARTLVDVRESPVVGSAPMKPGDGERVTVESDLLRKRPANEGANGGGESPTLTRTKGGGYAFAGNGFDAEIRADGSVRFHDRFADAELTFVPKVEPDGSVRYVFFRGSFDLTAWLDTLAGNDPYRSERRWFLEATKEVREKLAHEALERSLTRARQSLRNELFAIWEDPKLSLAQRKYEIFAHWDNTSDDEIGKRGRDVIVAFIVALCPKHSACAYDDEELIAFNHKRKVRAAFAPYAASE